MLKLSARLLLLCLSACLMIVLPAARGTLAQRTAPPLPGGLAPYPEGADRQTVLASFNRVPFRVDGAVSDAGEWATWQNPGAPLRSPGFNCSGYVVEAVRHLAGTNVPLAAALRDRDGDSGPDSELGEDWDFGLDLVQNLTGASLGDLLPPAEFKIQENKSGRPEGVGLDINGPLFPELLAGLARPATYLFVISKPDRAFKGGLSYYHVGVLDADRDGNLWFYQATARVGVHRLNLGDAAGVATFRRYFPPIRGAERRIALARLNLSDAPRPAPMAPAEDAARPAPETGGAMGAGSGPSGGPGGGGPSLNADEDAARADADHDAPADARDMTDEGPGAPRETDSRLGGLLARPRGGNPLDLVSWPRASVSRQYSPRARTAVGGTERPFSTHRGQDAGVLLGPPPKKDPPAPPRGMSGPSLPGAAPAAWLASLPGTGPAAGPVPSPAPLSETASPAEPPPLPETPARLPETAAATAAAADNDMAGDNDGPGDNDDLSGAENLAENLPENSGAPTGGDDSAPTGGAWASADAPGPDETDKEDYSPWQAAARLDSGGSAVMVEGDGLGGDVEVVFNFTPEAAGGSGPDGMVPDMPAPGNGRARSGAAVSGQLVSPRLAAGTVAEDALAPPSGTGTAELLTRPFIGPGDSSLAELADPVSLGAPAPEPVVVQPAGREPADTQILQAYLEPAALPPGQEIDGGLKIFELAP
ncbi:MAG: hypothetical protein LBP95_13145 [Deltaproteobacteria bacterium]|nr:hypothetical protein [Deltaproteobacteria bacterium]